MSTDAPKGIGFVDVTLRDLGAPPWGSRIAPDDLGSAAAALSPVGARVLEAMDPASARACMDGRTESPLDRLRVVSRHAGGAPVGIVLAGRTLLGDVPLGDGVARRLVASAVASVVGWALARFVFEFDWSVSPWVLLLGALAGALLALAAGWWGLREVLQRPVVQTLRRAAD